MFTVFLPPKVKFNIIRGKKTILIVFNKLFITSFSLPRSSTIYLNTFQRTLSIRSLLNINNSFNKLLLNWDWFYLKKITFTGKGYKIKKKENSIRLYFNHAHWTKLYIKKIILKKTNKRKITVSYRNLYKVSVIANLLRSIRPLNIYTKRGLRLSKQMIYKKRGKSNFS